MIIINSVVQNVNKEIVFLPTIMSSNRKWIRPKSWHFIELRHEHYVVSLNLSIKNGFDSMSIFTLGLLLPLTRKNPVVIEEVNIWIWLTTECSIQPNKIEHFIPSDGKNMIEVEMKNQPNQNQNRKKIWKK